MAIAIGIWAFGYHSFEFRRGARLVDSGIFTYPRYHAHLGEVPLWKNADYVFSVRGLPPGPLDLVLRVLNATHADREDLLSLNALVSVSIADGSGRIICNANGNLSDASKGGRSTWVLASSSTSAYYWQPGCQQLAIDRFKTYKIDVKVSGTDERTPRKILVPILQGGGIELP